MTAHLSPRGDIAIAEIIAYVPILIACGFLIARDGLVRGKGWCYLIVLSIIHIVGGGISIASEENSSGESLRAAAGALLSAGLSSLILSNLAFLRNVCEHGIDGEPIISIGLPALSIFCALAFGLTIVGGVKVGTAKTEKELSTATTLRHIGAILVALLVLKIVLFHVICWMKRPRILKTRQTLLTGITLGLPFIIVRATYTVLGSWAPTGRSISATGQVTTTSTSNSPLAQLNPITGSWVAYLVMSILTEYVVALLYVVIGARIPLRDGMDMGYAKSPMDEESEGRKDVMPGWRV